MRFPDFYFNNKNLMKVTDNAHTFGVLHYVVHLNSFVSNVSQTENPLTLRSFLLTAAVCWMVRIQSVSVIVQIGLRTSSFVASIVAWSGWFVRWIALFFAVCWK